MKKTLAQHLAVGADRLDARRLQVGQILALLVAADFAIGIPNMEKSIWASCWNRFVFLHTQRLRDVPVPVPFSICDARKRELAAGNPASRISRQPLAPIV